MLCSSRRCICLRCTLLVPVATVVHQAYHQQHDGYFDQHTRQACWGGQTTWLSGVQGLPPQQFSVKYDSNWFMPSICAE